MTTVAVWFGSDQDWRTLMTAVERNCICDPTIPHVCASHRMLSDQRVLDHLAFVARRRTMHQQAEHDPTGEWF